MAGVLLLFAVVLVLILYKFTQDNVRAPRWLVLTIFVFGGMFSVFGIAPIFHYNFDLPVNKEMFSRRQIYHEPTCKSIPSILNHTNYDKWIIVTSISHPTEQIQILSRIPGWKLLVVGDKKTPKNWTYPGVIFLDEETQLRLGYQVLKHLPWNSYTRKVIGYLYAIQHGALVVYDTDDDNAPNNLTTFEQDFALSSPARGLLLQNYVNDGTGDDFSVRNPYQHFGQGSIWPRGYPLQAIGEEVSNNYSLCFKMAAPLVQQGLVDGDPDVDAIFRLTRKKLHSQLCVQFDGLAPPLFYPKGLLAPFNSQNTIFKYDAFWALLLPTSVAFRVTDIWRGYWAQPLLWLIGGTLGFYSPHTTQIRNAHIYLKDFAEEVQMYKQSGELVKLLTNWSCSKEELFECMLELTSLMVEKRMWDASELRLLNAWISDLKCVGYKVPKLRLETIPSSPCGGRENFVAFHGVSTVGGEKKEDNLRVPLRQFCNLPMYAGNSRNKSEGSLPLKYPSTLLVVTFNIPHYENIWLLDLVYRPHYPNILYCGAIERGTYYKLVGSEAFVKAGVTTFSFVHANLSNGYFAYECGIQAVAMNYGVSNYIVLSDDVLLNFWNNGKFNPEEMWGFRENLQVRDTAAPYDSLVWSGWMWWRGPFGLNATKKALRLIYSSTDDPLAQFTANRESFGINASTVMYAESDIFHLPRSKQEIFYAVASVLRECEVFLEIAVPLITSGISSPGNAVSLSGESLWGSGRTSPLSHFNGSTSIIHPVKLSQIISNSTKREEYCEKYVGKLIFD